MELNFNKIIIKNINDTFNKIKSSKDLPFNLDGINFNRNYNDIENIAEVLEYKKIMDQVKEQLNVDYKIYSNETHINFREFYYNYSSSLKMINTFKEKFNYALIEYNAEDLLKVSEIGTQTLLDQMDYLNIKYKELFLSFEDYNFIKFITNEYKEFIKQNGDFLFIIDYMCRFNINLFKFKNKLIDQQVDVDDKLIEFINDLTETFYTFRVYLKIYFRFMVSNGYSDENVIKYSITYFK